MNKNKTKSIGVSSGTVTIKELIDHFKKRSKPVSTTLDVKKLLTIINENTLKNERK